MAQIMLRDYLQETEDAISAKRFDEAFERCQRVLNQFPELLEAQRLLGKVYMAQGNLEDAQQMFDWVLTNDPENAVVYCDRALLSEHMSDVDTALDCYQQAYELSRGNGQIRLDFNRLSARADQQGFMFSRAGLARLYMRGDLLPQALQEWEIVLASSPERFDARLGLLETCWREGHLERAEQIARQIVQDVPGCLKALLLLSFIISPTDMRESQELIQHAATLDPELLMAQDLFADVMASQPGNPFFKLLKKEPVVVAGTHAEVSGVGTGAPKDAAASAHTMPQWNNLDEWNNIEVIRNAQTAENPVAFVPRPNGTTINDVPWNALDKPQEQPVESPSSPRLEDQSTYEVKEATQAAPANGTVNDNIWSALEQNIQAGDSFDVWSPMQAAVQNPDAEHTVNTLDQAQQHKMSNDQFAEVPPDELDPWSGLTNAYASSAANSSNAWEIQSVQNEQQVEAPIPPSWLNMLTQGEPEQINELQPTPSLRTHESQNAPEAAVASHNEEAAMSFQSAWNAEPQAMPQEVSGVEKQDEEPSFFGPAWLKSLGAASFSGLSADDTAAPPPSFTEPEPWNAQAQQAQEEEPTYQPSAPKRQDQEFTYEPWQPHMQEEELVYEPWVPKAQDQEPTYEFWQQSAQEHEAQELGQQEEDEPWQAQLQKPVATTEQTFLATLQNMESDLRSQGFVPLEPNSLSTIAQAATSEAPKEGAETRSQEEEQLSSAFTHFGTFDYGHAPAPKSSDVPVQPPSVEQPEEPLWAASLRAGPPPRPVTNVPQETPIAPTKQETAPLLQPAASVQPAPKQEQAVTRQVTLPQPTRVDVLPGPIFKPEVVPVTPTPVYAPQREPAKVPMARANTTFDSDFELETTMKRPAVRLQTMQAQRFAERSVVQPPSQAVSVGNGRMGEQPSVGKASDGATVYKDRLVKGYQHQLVGDYDEAMQEYRVIVRNVPELLGEVVSNVRALLKLAPKYAAGYRVLGDAYMRQGEYLQAMEAYNKALNMAKKARS